MILGIDLSNICVGGGITHISEVLRCVKPIDFGFKCIVVWGGVKPLSNLYEKSWLEKVYVPILDRKLPWRVWWQQFILPKSLEQKHCNLLFSPGGTLPYRLSLSAVTMSRNMLPFEPEEAARYDSVLMRLRLKLLNPVQKMSLHKADGFIFLTQYAKERICSQLKKELPRSVIVQQGINNKFFLFPRNQKPIDYYSLTNPFRLLYVSSVDVYKHQWYVAEAITALRNKGIPVTIDFIGSFYPQAMRRFKSTLQQVDSNGDFITYIGYTPYNELAKAYHSADAFVFASSCENMPNILLEAMAAGLPIACSNRGPMPEVLGQGGVYFDPESPYEIAETLHDLITNVDLRKCCALTAYKRVKKKTWEHCANETFLFLAEVAQIKSLNH